MFFINVGDWLKHAFFHPFEKSRRMTIDNIRSLTAKEPCFYCCSIIFLKHFKIYGCTGMRSHKSITSFLVTINFRGRSPSTEGNFTSRTGIFFGAFCTFFRRFSAFCFFSSSSFISRRASAGSCAHHHDAGKQQS